MRAAQDADETARWRDFGYYSTFPIALLSMLWFRKGWTVRLSIAVILVLPGCSAEVWLTPDQQGRIAFERGGFGEAGERFSDPMWQGAAFFRAGDYERALDAFARVDSAEAYFNLGNSYAWLENYEQAAASYQTALERRPDWTQARENMALVMARIPAAPDDDDPSAGGEPHFSADEVQFDDKADQGTRGEVEMSAFTEDQVAEMWMRRLSTSPADFLRRRFAMGGVVSMSGIFLLALLLQDPAPFARTRLEPGSGCYRRATDLHPRRSARSCLFHGRAAISRARSCGCARRVRAAGCEL